MKGSFHQVKRGASKNYCSMLLLLALAAAASLSTGCGLRELLSETQTYSCILEIHPYYIDVSHCGFGYFSGGGDLEFLEQDANTHVAVLEARHGQIVTEVARWPRAKEMKVWHDRRTERDCWVALEDLSDGIDLVLYGLEHLSEENSYDIREFGRCALVRGETDMPGHNRVILFAGDSLRSDVVVYVSGPRSRPPGQVFVVDPFTMSVRFIYTDSLAHVSDAMFMENGLLVLTNQVPTGMGKGFIRCLDCGGQELWRVEVGGYASGGGIYRDSPSSRLATIFVRHYYEADSIAACIYVTAPGENRVLSRRSFPEAMTGLTMFEPKDREGMRIMAYSSRTGFLVMDSTLQTIRSCPTNVNMSEVFLGRTTPRSPLRPALEGNNRLVWLDRDGIVRSSCSIPPTAYCSAFQLIPFGTGLEKWLLHGWAGGTSENQVMMLATLRPIPSYGQIIFAVGMVILFLGLAVIVQQLRARRLFQYVAAFQGLGEQGALGFSDDGKLLVCLGVARHFCKEKWKRKRSRWHEVIQPQFKGLVKVVATLQRSQSDFERSFILTDRNDEWNMLARGKLASSSRSRVRRILYLSPESGSWRRLKDETFSILHDLKARLGTLARVFEKRDTAQPDVLHVVPEIQEITESLSEVMKLGQILNPRQDPLDLATIAETMVARIRSVHPRITWSVKGTGSAVIYADERLLKRLLSVLLQNAAEALFDTIEPKVSIIVSSDFYCFDPSLPTLEQPAVVLEVADNGPGMSEEVLSKAFTSPVSSKGDTRGHGLLDVRKIVDAHGAGLVWSSTNSGSTFRVYFQELKVAR